MLNLNNTLQTISTFPPKPNLWDTAREVLATPDNDAIWVLRNNISTDTVHKFRGRNTVKFSAPDASSAYGTLSIGTKDLSAKDYVEIWLYINNTAFIGSGGLNVYLANNDNATNSYVTNLKTKLQLSGESGWRRVRVPKVEFATLGTPNWSTIQYIRITAFGSGGTLEVSVAQLDAVALRAGAVSINFDDGYSDVYDNAFPILEKYGLTATLYVITNNIGTAGYLTWEQLRRLQDAGWTIGSHTDTHLFLDTATQAQIQQEFDLSQAKLRRHGIITGAKFVAAPAGRWSATARAEAKTRFIAARIGGSKPVYDPLPVDDNYTVRYFSTTNVDTPTTVQGWIDTVISSKRWAHLTFHHILDPADVDTKYTPADFDTVCSYIANQRDAGNLLVLTEEDAFLQFRGVTCQFNNNRILLSHDGSMPVVLRL